MKAIALQQPWASLIACGISDVANLPESPNLSEQVLLVASHTPVSEDLFEQIPVEYSATIGNNILMGNLPQLDSLPLNTIVGYANISGESTEITEDTPIWGTGPVIIQFDNVHIFDKPIKLADKITENSIFEIPETKIGTLPPSHKPATRSLYLNGDELIVPLAAKYFNEITALTHKFVNFELADSNIADIVLTESDKYNLIKYKTVKLISDNGKSVRFERSRDTAIQAYTDDSGNPIMVPSIWTQNPIEWIVAHISLGKSVK